jgi:hypothetical protein
MGVQMTNHIGYLLIVVMVFCIWLFTEFRSGMWTHLLVSVVLVLILSIGVYGLFCSTDFEVHTHRVCLQLIDHRLACQQKQLVHLAIESYLKKHSEEMRLGTCSIGPISQLRDSLSNGLDAYQLISDNAIIREGKLIQGSQRPFYILHTVEQPQFCKLC